MDKFTKINAEVDRLRQFYADLSPNRFALVEPLIEQAAFMRVTLDGLQETINENGVSDEYKNGANQYGTKASAEMSAYNSLVKNYANIIDKLDKMLPSAKTRSKLDEMMSE